MHLALISNTDLGAASFTTSLAHKGHTIRIYLPDSLCQNQPANSLISFSPLPSLPHPFHPNTRIITSFPLQIPTLLDKFRPDIVHFENPQLHIFFPVYYWCKIHKKPLLTSAFSVKPSFINKSLYTMSDKIYEFSEINSYAQTLTGLLHR